MTVTATPVHDPYEQQSVRRQADAIAAVLATTSNPKMPTATADALAADALVHKLKNDKLDLDAIAARLATCGPKRLQEELESAIEQSARQASLDAVLGALTDARLVGTLKTALDHDHAEVATRLRAAFTTAVADLTTASARLPGADPLADHSAILQAGAGAEWTIAQTAVATIRAAGQAFNSGDLHLKMGNADGKLGALVPVVSTPDVEKETIDAYTYVSLDDPDSLDAVNAVRAYAQAAVAHGPDVAVLRVARGDWDGVQLALADDRTELLNRCKRLHSAHTAQTSRNTSGVRLVR